jgi:hypothetical protein
MLCYSIEMVAPDQVRRRRVLLVEDDDNPASAWEKVTYEDRTVDHCSCLEH